MSKHSSQHSRLGRARSWGAWVSLLALTISAASSTGFAQGKPEGAALPLLAAPAPTAPVSGYALAWSDEFDGDALDRSKWDFRTDSKHLSQQKPENVSIGDGRLRLALKKESAGGKQYTGGGVISKTTFKHGFYEARMKVTAAAGWHSAFWLMKHDGSGSTDSQDAMLGIDVFQNNSINPRAYVVCIRKYNPEPPVVHGFNTIPTPDVAADFHVFGCEFTAQAVKFFLDGQLVQSTDAEEFAHGEMNIWLTSIASHLGATQAVDDSSLPSMVECDYVRFFEKPANAGKDSRATVNTDGI